MKLKISETGQWTRVKTETDIDLDIQSAANRLVARKMGSKEYFAHRATGWSNWPDGWDNLPVKFAVEICRVVGELSEHHNIIELTLEREKKERTSIGHRNGPAGDH